MIVIREKVNEEGMAYFDILETQTGLYRHWEPDAKMPATAKEFALIKIATDLEYEANFCTEISDTDRRANLSLLPAYSQRVPSNDPCNASADQETSNICTMTFRDYCESVFWPRKNVDLAENTRSSWSQICRKRLYPTFGTMTMQAITPGILTDFFTSLKKEGLKNSSVIKHYTILNSIFKMANMIDQLPVNPIDRIQRPTPRKDEVKRNKPEAFTEEEVIFLEHCMTDAPLKWQAFVALLNDTGIRRGEAVALRWENVNFAKKTIKIAGNMCYTPEKGVYLDTTKNQINREVSIGDDVLFLLVKLYQLNRKTLKSKYVFTQRNNPAPMHPTTPTNYFRKLRSRYQIDHLHPHKLRHSFASIAITNGADVASVSEILGHCDKAVTLRMYTSANSDSMKKASNIRRSAVKEACQNN